ncbi:MAG: acyl-CoA reductase [Myxococcota bacterium]
MLSPDSLRAKAAELASHALALRSISLEQIADALANAAALLRNADSDIGQRARRDLPKSSGLDSKMVAWALDVSLGEFTQEKLLEAWHRWQPASLPTQSPRLTVQLLAGNVFSASFSAIALPLLARSPVIAKASVRELAGPLLFAEAIRASDADLGMAVEVVSFARSDPSLLRALVSQADVVGVYGSDRTLADIRASLPATTHFQPHGHGLGVAHVSRDVLEDDALAQDAARGLALDVAAYDQRGCLSPHAAFIEAKSERAGEIFCERVFEQLGTLHAELPRGSLPMSVGAAQLQWRGVAASRGTLLEGDGFAVSYEGDGPLRLSPGYRNLGVYLVKDQGRFFARLAPLGAHLKAIGTSVDQVPVLRRDIPPPLAPRISTLGTMQKPPLGGPADGLNPFAGLCRFLG